MTWPVTLGSPPSWGPPRLCDFPDFRGSLRLASARQEIDQGNEGVGPVPGLGIPGCFEGSKSRLCCIQGVNYLIH